MNYALARFARIGLYILLIEVIILEGYTLLAQADPTSLVVSAIVLLAWIVFWTLVFWKK